MGEKGGGGGVNIDHSTNCKGMTDYGLDLALSIKGTTISINSSPRSKRRSLIIGSESQRSGISLDHFQVHWKVINKPNGAQQNSVN